MSDIPEGYRMSEVGVIPEAREAKMLGEIVRNFFYEEIFKKFGKGREVHYTIK